ncbi:MAG TPA: lipid II flippase MurJ, partial [Stackebrandtia sp.]|uniref:murein biosynthesis integral membrane protein MurJ n=1 Tax=Stackebrandtia sp. TaxID=2023065 RepID=UPI002D697488
MRGPVAGERRGGIGAGAVVIGGITAVSRAVGFARVLVLTWAVGIGGVLDVYNTAGRVPNILYEIVAGGALSSVVVPLVAGPLARRRPVLAERAASGLLTWALLILVPAAALVAAFAHPIMSLLDGSGDAERVALGAAMIRVFAPQLPLYGVGVVLTGVLHAHRAFAWPALAPLLSSLAVIGAYAWYGAVWRGSTVGGLDAAGWLVLSIGTTAATVAMTGCLLIPLRRIRFRWRPSVRFGSQLSRRVRAAAVAGGIGVAAWQVSLLLNLGLTNAGPTGTVAVYTIALT